MDISFNYSYLFWSDPNGKQGNIAFRNAAREHSNAAGAPEDVQMEERDYAGENCAKHMLKLYLRESDKEIELFLLNSRLKCQGAGL